MPTITGHSILIKYTKNKIILIIYEYRELRIIDALKVNLVIVNKALLIVNEEGLEIKTL